MRPARRKVAGALSRLPVAPDQQALFVPKEKNHMAKIKLGARPKSFKRVVKFPMLEGEEGAITIEYRYRTRKEFGAFIDELIAEAGEDKPRDDKFSMAELMAKTTTSNAEYLMRVVEGWDLDEPFTRKSVDQLCDELPSAVHAIMEMYRLAINEGRLGN